jgi:hypothetical protein
VLSAPLLLPHVPAVVQAVLLRMLAAVRLLHVLLQRMLRG